MKKTIRLSLLATAVIVLASGFALPASLTASAAPAQSARGAAGSPADGRLHATFTDSAVKVTHRHGMVELILTGTGTVQGFGAATDVVGVVEDFAASPCGPGGASNSSQDRIAVHGGVLELSTTGMNCVTASGPQVTGTYRVDGQASTGIFAGARGAGHFTVSAATGQDRLSGTLILVEPGAWQAVLAPPAADTVSSAGGSSTNLRDTTSGPNGTCGTDCTAAAGDDLVTCPGSPLSYP